MMDTMLYSLAVLFCLAGVLVSSLGFSGTWIVLAAALMTRFTLDLPGVGTLVGFGLVCLAAEGLEAVAGFAGVRRRGGSRRAGALAVAGGLIGAAVGSAVFPVLGTIAGMISGSFLTAFLVEWQRLKHHGQAAHIAWGTVWARLLVLLMKTVLTLGMSIHLLTRLLR
jgi:uncharacterized protein